MVQLKKLQAVALAILNATVAVCVYVATQKPEYAFYAMAIVTGIEAALHYEDNPKPSS